MKRTKNPPTAITKTDPPTPVRANRRGGPSTPLGKAIASQNSLKHGLHAKSVIIERLGETQAAWTRHRNGVREACKPADPVELALIDQIAELLHRMNRVTAARQASTEQDAAEHQARTAVSLELGDNEAIDRANRLTGLPSLKRLVKLDATEAHILKAIGACQRNLQRHRELKGMIVLEQRVEKVLKRQNGLAEVRTTDRATRRVSER